jgi:hypothetical protein
VRFLSLFVKLALQTNKKLGLKSLQWVLLQIMPDKEYKGILD